MGFFTRTGRNSPDTHRGIQVSYDEDLEGGNEPYTMAKYPTFRQWFKHIWVDLLTMICMGAIGLGVYYARPAPTRSFPVTFSDGEVVYPEFAYPLRQEIIPIWLAAFLGSMLPITIIMTMQIRVRSFWDANNAIIGLLYSLITAAVFQVFLKWLIGGLRPHFLDVCRPDTSLATNRPGAVGAGYNGAGFNGIYYTREICTGDSGQIDDSLESFPSGHATAAFAGFVYLYLYLNAKLKVFANYRPAMWKLVALYAPILAAVLIAGTLTIDEFHNWYDVLAGAAVGTAMAFSAYRMCFAAVWDWRWNHVPLHRIVPLDLGGPSVLPELAGATFTRSAGWGLSGKAAIPVAAVRGASVPSVGAVKVASPTTAAATSVDRYIDVTDFTAGGGHSSPHDQHPQEATAASSSSSRSGPLGSIKQPARKPVGSAPRMRVQGMV